MNNNVSINIGRLNTKTQSNIKYLKASENKINLGSSPDVMTEYDEIDYNQGERGVYAHYNRVSRAKQSGLYRASTAGHIDLNIFDETVTLVASFVFGVLDVVENISDGLVMLGGEIDSFCYSIIGNEEMAEATKKATQEYVQYDWTEAGYGATVEALGVDEDVAYSELHQLGTVAGSMTGYAALSLVPGGELVTATTGFLSAKGSSAEHAFQSGATFEEASVTSTVAGAAGALSGAALNKVQGAAKGASSIKDVAKFTAKGMAVSATEPVVNSVTEYATYGKDMVDENGNPLYDNFGEYYVESGGLLNTAIAGGVGGLSTGVQATSGYSNNIKTQQNRVDNLENIFNKMEASTFDRIKNKAFLKNQSKYSDEAAFNLYKLSIEDAIGKAKQAGNKDIQNMLEKLYLLKNKRPSFGIYFDPDNGAFSDSHISGSISLGADVISGNQKGVVYHELGHTLHGAINDSSVPSNYMDVKKSVYNHMSENPSFVKDCMEYINNAQSLAYSDAEIYFDTNLSADAVKQVQNTNWDEVVNNYRSCGFSEDQIAIFLNADANNLYENIRINEVCKIADTIQREYGVDAVSDIIGSIYNGKKRFAVLDKNGNKVYLGGDTTYSHDIDYYTTKKDNDGKVIRKRTINEINEISFHEQMANYVSLKLADNKDHLNMLRSLLGDDWMQMMEKEFNNILNYFK